MWGWLDTLTVEQLDLIAKASFWAGSALGLIALILGAIHFQAGTRRDVLEDRKTRERVEALEETAPRRFTADQLETLRERLTSVPAGTLYFEIVQGANDAAHLATQLTELLTDLGWDVGIGRYSVKKEPVPVGLALLIGADEDTERIELEDAPPHYIHLGKALLDLGLLTDQGLASNFPAGSVWLRIGLPPQ